MIKSMSRHMKKEKKKSSRKSRGIPLKDFYEQWINTLKTTLLPDLRRAMLASSANLLSTHVHHLHLHFLSYFHALDTATSATAAAAAARDTSPLAFPLLWLGDFHPNLFTNLLRSFLTNNPPHPQSNNFFPNAWTEPSPELVARIEQIECGLRLMVPSVANQLRKAQAGFVDRVAVHWGQCDGREEVSRMIGAALAAQGEVLESVFLDANRLRRSVLSEILSCVDVYQAALFLEKLAHFYVGFSDGDLIREFEQCKLHL
ncbi:hypothetical protein Scep_006807 [Stephania cephalantha]|uniref:DOG1 domain-containing protein n=1 Tax=Stephania cephalantha TaxID=152367 RepID=A0AAP0KBD8_9MAGN